MVSAELVHYRGAGQEGYASSSDVYTTEAYAAYAAAQRAKAANARAAARRNVSLRGHLEPVPMPASVRAMGYESSILVGLARSPIWRCDVPRAAGYVEAARSAFSAKSYSIARAYAWSGVVYTSDCHNEDRNANTYGDAMLIFAKSEIRLGNLTAGKNDADAAAASYGECMSHDELFDDTTRAYCDQHHDEAKNISDNG